MSSKPRFFHHYQDDQTVIIYQIKNTIEHTPIEDVPCPCCEGPMLPKADFVQFGLFDDAYLTVFTCDACGVAIEFKYNFATYALVAKREQQATGVLLSKKSAEGGKAKS